MSYFLITSMHQDWCRFSQDRLVEMGLSSTVDASDMGLSLDRFTAKISKAHKVSAERSTKFRQISPGNAWHISASSVIIDNAERENWCWGSPENIFFMDFWKEFDPLCRFILVFGGFEDLLARQSKVRNLTSKTKDALAERWKAYHAEMLRFYHENKERCVLIDVYAFESQITEISRLMLERFNVQTRNINSRETLKGDPVELLAAYNFVDAMENSAIADMLNEFENIADIQSDKAEKISNLSDAALEKYELLDTKCKSLEDQLIRKDDAFGKKLTSINANAKQLLLAEKEKRADVEAELAQNSLRNAETVKQLHAVQEELEKSMQKQTKVEHKLSQKTALAEDLSTESKLMMAQLHQVQEELEIYFRKSIEAENKPIQPKRVSDVKTLPKHAETIIDDQPNSALDIIVDFSNYFSGNGWHNSEGNGRWAGDSKISTVFIDGLTASDYDLKVRILDGMSLEILEGLKLLLNGQPLNTSLKKLSNLRGPLAPIRRLKAAIDQIEKPYPALISATIPSEMIDKSKRYQSIEFVVPKVTSPSSNGSTDTRELSLFYDTLRLTAKR